MGKCRRIPFTNHIPAAYNAILQKWILNVLVDFGGHKQVIVESGVTDADLLNFLGLSRLVEAEGKSFNPGEARAALRAKLAEVEGKNISIPTRTVLGKNLKWLGKMLGLTPLDQALFLFFVLQDQHPMLEGTMTFINKISIGGVFRVLSRLLDVSVDQIRKSLSFQSPLIRSGLLHVELDRDYSFLGKVQLMGGLAEKMCLPQDEPMQLFSEKFRPSVDALLQIENYPHLCEDLPILSAYLKEALQTKRKGVNILIHGVPGTGKTQFARVMAKELKCQLFEVASEKENGTAVFGLQRFRAFRLSQAILKARPQTLVLFDEVEDVFTEKTGPEGADDTRGIKAFINRHLEENPLPAFWITNALSELDPAFIRRFDYVLELGVPPRSVREKVIEQYLGHLPVTPAWKDAMAGHECLAPALVERAAKVITKAWEAEPELSITRSLSRVLGNTLEAMGGSRDVRGQIAPVLGYRLDVLNTDRELDKIQAGLLAHGQGRMCLYGPPGTGKTAFGHHLAKVMDRPLLIKRASDLQSKWVGGTEKNIAHMFEEARVDKAVLLLDEADSFLQDRGQATQSWEISHVNEMLTQMEAFEGVFIASTNLMQSLDIASLRRFDLKIRFDYLKAEQAWALFQEVATQLQLTDVETAQSALARLKSLTPGDFATVLRQARLDPVESAGDLVHRLGQELKARPGAGRVAIGFAGARRE